VADNSELIVRFHPVAGEDVTLLTTDFGAPDEALQAIARALDERRSLILTHARYNREAGQNAGVINLANVVFVRVSRNDSETTGQYLYPPRRGPRGAGLGQTRSTTYTGDEGR
jgi:hypothetical protein